MDYRKILGGVFWARVIQQKESGSWAVEKYRGSEVIRYSVGKDYRGAMLHATINEYAARPRPMADDRSKRESDT